eukprot:3669078-Pyramimonas_sp.AAC.2
MSPTLATVVRAGLKPGESVVRYLGVATNGEDAAMRVAAMEETMPTTLADLCAAEEVLGITPSRVWATMLALAVAEASPLRATLNPAAVAEGGATPVSVIGEAQGWLEHIVTQVGNGRILMQGRET